MPFRNESLGEEISGGSHADVYELKKDKDSPPDRVVKMGKKDYALPVLDAFKKFAIPREKASKILETLFGPKFKINPDLDFIKNGVAEYALMSRYFSNKSESEEEKWGNPRDKILSDLRDNTSSFYQELGSFLDKEEIEKVASVFEECKSENFLPKEQVVIGHPPDLTTEKAKELQAEGKELPYTYYLIQEMIKGEKVMPLAKTKEEELKRHPELLKKLLTFGILAKRMYDDTDQLIDTRPDEVAKHPFEWFQKTSNILVDLEKDEVYFVDTRWLYDRNDTKFIGRGGLDLYDKLGRRSIDRAIKKYTDLLDRQKK